MGITIHYSGQIAQPNQLENLIEEVEDIAKVHQWRYFVYERKLPENALKNSEKQHDGKLYGISFTPPQCEPVSFCFMSNGRMCGIFNYVAWKDATEEPELTYLYMPHTKTQFTEIEIHINLINIFRYISDKYLINFQLTDEGEYWETNDAELLKKNFEKYSSIIDLVGDIVSNTKKNNSESDEQYIARIINKIEKRKPE